MSDDLTRRVHVALNRLGKWRTVFAGRQLGTRPDTDIECIAVKDYQEARLMFRVEITTLTGLLIDKGIFTMEEFQERLIEEAAHCERQLEERFPGFTATDDGMRMDHRVIETMIGWPP